MDATEEEDAHALCLGLYMLSIRDGAEAAEGEGGLAADPARRAGDDGGAAEGVVGEARERLWGVHI